MQEMSVDGTRKLSGRPWLNCTSRPPTLTLPHERTSGFLEGMGDLAKKSGLPVFWQIAHDVRRF